VEETNKSNGSRFRKDLDKLIGDIDATLLKLKEQNALQTVDHQSALSIPYYILMSPTWFPLI